jgi:hypothetical protein
VSTMSWNRSKKVKTEMDITRDNWDREWVRWSTAQSGPGQCGSPYGSGLNNGDMSYDSPRMHSSTIKRNICKRVLTADKFLVPSEQRPARRRTLTSMRYVFDSVQIFYGAVDALPKRLGAGVIRDGVCVDDQYVGYVRCCNRRPEEILDAAVRSVRCAVLLDATAWGLASWRKKRRSVHPGRMLKALCVR